MVVIVLDIIRLVVSDG